LSDLSDEIRAELTLGLEMNMKRRYISLIFLLSLLLLPLSVGFAAKATHAPHENSDGGAIVVAFVIGAIIYIAVKLATHRKYSQMVCKSCGTVGKSKNHMPGSIFIELILWCCFLVPGMIYTVWRHSSAGRVCSACGSKEMIPVSSPLGQQIVSKTPSDKTGTAN
jgi:uncharacterized membrane protein